MGCVLILEKHITLLVCVRVDGWMGVGVEYSYVQSATSQTWSPTPLIILIFIFTLKTSCLHVGQ